MLQQGLLAPPEEVEVRSPSGRLQHARVYSVTLAATALGKVRQTVVNWISTGVIPAPVYTRATADRYRYYLEDELKAIAGVLARHERDYLYLTRKHEVVVAELHHVVQTVRRQHP